MDNKSHISPMLCLSSAGVTSKYLVDVIKYNNLVSKQNINETTCLQDLSKLQQI